MPLGRYSDDDTSPPSPGRPSAALPSPTVTHPCLLPTIHRRHPLYHLSPGRSLPPPSLAAALLRPFRSPFSCEVCDDLLVAAPRPRLTLCVPPPPSSSSFLRLPLPSSLHPPPRYTRLIKRGKLPNEISIRLETPTPASRPDRLTRGSSRIVYF